MGAQAPTQNEAEHGRGEKASEAYGQSNLSHFTVTS
jgi:hypothetical protein